MPAESRETVEKIFKDIHEELNKCSGDEELWHEESQASRKESLVSYISKKNIEINPEGGFKEDRASRKESLKQLMVSIIIYYKMHENRDKSKLVKEVRAALTKGHSQLASEVMLEMASEGSAISCQVFVGLMSLPGITAMLKRNSGLVLKVLQAAAKVGAITFMFELECRGFQIALSRLENDSSYLVDIGDLSGTEDDEYSESRWSCPQKVFLAKGLIAKGATIVGIKDEAYNSAVSRDVLKHRADLGEVVKAWLTRILDGVEPKDPFVSLEEVEHAYNIADEILTDRFTKQGLEEYKAGRSGFVASVGAGGVALGELTDADYISSLIAGCGASRPTKGADGQQIEVKPLLVAYMLCGHRGVGKTNAMKLVGRNYNNLNEITR